jgi:hypothetical protein
MNTGQQMVRGLVVYVVVALACVGGVACDPAAYIVVRQPIQPLVQPDCIRKTLAASPQVAWLQPKTDPKATNFQIALRDSLAGPSVGGGEFSLQTGDDSIERAVIRFMWIGTLASRPAAVKDRSLAIGAAVLESVQRECAPGCSAPPSCGEANLGHERVRPCGPAA